MLVRMARSILGVALLAGAPVLLLLAVGATIPEAANMLVCGVSLFVGGQLLRSGLTQAQQVQSAPLPADRVGILSNPG